VEALLTLPFSHGTPGVSPGVRQPGVANTQWQADKLFNTCNAQVVPTKRDTRSPRGVRMNGFMETAIRRPYTHIGRDAHTHALGAMRLWFPGREGARPAWGKRS
jgi:hypothetical protein